VGLKASLARHAAAHAHVLVVEAAGRWRTRAAVERHVLQRGWVLARSPADADVLAVCGRPGGRLAAAVEHVWHQLPGPRVRVDVESADEVPAALARAAAEVLETARHVDDSRTRPGPHDLRPSGAEHTGTGHDELAPHGHADMDMAPDGIALAGGGEDRDGLEMDVLHVRLGPVLPHWPGGLALRCSLQGDVITAAEVDVVDEPASGSAEEGPVCAALCAGISDVLALAGRTDAAAVAMRVRDRLLADVAERSPAAADLRLLHRKVARSWLLRWSLRGVGTVHDREGDEHGLPAAARGDTLDRLLRMLERAEQALLDLDASASDDNSRHVGSSARRYPVPVTAVPPLVTGLDLAAARLVVASLDLDLLPTGDEAAHA
jgi:hypothetical protein